ncbi:hypothetical protein HY967_04810 [Candidatus Jorgensenbacteria bacterium]|nr:hypothetical protein [Candidatus Jorgensenbacteria bacterium]
MATVLIAPKGKVRVVRVDLFSHEDHLVKDCDTEAEAFAIADEHNKKRTGSMEDILYVYNDKGEYLRGNEAVQQDISP